MQWAVHERVLVPWETVVSCGEMSFGDGTLELFERLQFDSRDPLILHLF